MKRLHRFVSPEGIKYKYEQVYVISERGIKIELEPVGYLWYNEATGAYVCIYFKV